MVPIGCASLSVLPPLGDLSHHLAKLQIQKAKGRDCVTWRPHVSRNVIGVLSDLLRLQEQALDCFPLRQTTNLAILANRANCC